MHLELQGLAAKARYQFLAEITLQKALN